MPVANMTQRDTDTDPMSLNAMHENKLSQWTTPDLSAPVKKQHELCSDTHTQEENPAKSKLKRGKRKTHIEYQLLERIGHGAYGVVYKALNKVKNTELAIKIINFEDDEILSDQMSEIDLLKNLKHENIVKYHGFIQKTHKLYILLEYCSNGSLRDLIKRQTAGCLNETVAKTYIKQTLRGLKYLHDQGVIHRDVKAANLLLTEKDIIKLADFGVSTKVTNIAMTCVGSPNWMAPEILLGQGATTKSDIWSIGATVVEILTGDPPFFDLNNREAVCYAVMHDIYHPPPKFNLSANAKNFIKKCFNKNIFKRPSAEFLLSNDNWLSSDDIALKKTTKLSKFKEVDDFYKGFGESDFLGSPKKTTLQQQPSSLSSSSAHTMHTPSLYSSVPSFAQTPPPHSASNTFFSAAPNKNNNNNNTDLVTISGTPSPKKHQHSSGSSGSISSTYTLSHNIKNSHLVNTMYSQRSISSASSFNEDLELESGHVVLKDNEYFHNYKFNETMLEKIFEDCSAQSISEKLLNICLDAEKDPQNNLFAIFKYSRNFPNFQTFFANIQGHLSLIDYIAQLSPHLKLKWYTLLTATPQFNYFFHIPKLYAIIDFEESLDPLVLVKIILKFSKELLHKYNGVYLEPIIVSRCLPYLYNHIDIIKSSSNRQYEEEHFQHLLYQATELGYMVCESDLKKIINLPNWQFPVLKILNNCCKNNSFQLPFFAFQWLVSEILPSYILNKFDKLSPQTHTSANQIQLVDYKIVRYFLEVLYATIHLNQTYTPFLLSNLNIPKLAIRLIDLNKVSFELNDGPNDETLNKYYNYVVKYVIRLCSELSADLNSINTFNEPLLEAYCLVGFHHLKYFQNSTYSWCAIDILSNSLPKLYQKNLIKFQMNSISYKTENFNSVLILQNFFNESIINSQDCEKVFKKINKLLLACSNTQKFYNNAEGNIEVGTNIIDTQATKISYDESLQGVDGIGVGHNSKNEPLGANHDKKHDKTTKSSITKNIPPFAQLLVDDGKFYQTVEKILEKYKGSLIIQIDFLKFLKTLFFQYVQFRFNEFSQLEQNNYQNTSHETKDIDYLQLAMNNKNKTAHKKTKSFSYDHLKNSHLETRTNNFRQVNQLLSSLWEEDDYEDEDYGQYHRQHDIDELELSPSKQSVASSLQTMALSNKNKQPTKRVGYNSILIKQLVKDINKIYNESITLA